MGVATVQETVTVTGESPVIDAKAMGTATNFTQDELSRVPNSRDPWALLRTVPGVTLDRVNIAGNETGQQSAFVSKGGRQGDAVWTMDGVPITDMSTTARRRPISTTTRSTKSRSQPAATTSVSRPAVSVSISSSSAAPTSSAAPPVATSPSDGLESTNLPGRTARRAA